LGHLAGTAGSIGAPHFSHAGFDPFFFPVLNHDVNGAVMKIVML
jgi:hypothetical protein